MKNETRKIGGIIPALVTPMNEDGSRLNLETVPALIDFLIGRGVSGFFVAGGTGEGLLLTLDERRRLLERVVEHVGSRASVIAHIGTLATDEAADLAAHAASLGVDAVSAIPPIYFRVDRASLIEHYRRIAQAAGDAQTYVYNIPGATGVEIDRSLMSELSQIPGVRGIKYTSMNLFDLQQISRLDPPITVLSGFDEICVAGLSMGAQGAVGTTYNLMPATFSALFRAAQEGEWDRARGLQERANRVIQALLVAPMVAGVKLILSDWGFSCGTTRRPQRPLTEDEKSRLRRAIDEAGLVKLEEEALSMLNQTQGAD